MSHSRKASNEMGLDSLSDRFHDSFCIDQNKPDFKEVDLGGGPHHVPSSSVTRGGSNGGPTTTTSTSAALVSNNPPFIKRSNGIASNLSGELEMGPNSSRSATKTRDSRPGHRRSVSSGPTLIYSGNYNSSSSSGSTTSGGGCGGGGGGATSVSSRSPIMYPSGNICPSGKILKSNMGHRSSHRTETLGLGTGNYGHGSIMRSGGGNCSNGGSAVKLDTLTTGNPQIARDFGVAKRAIPSTDPEELKKAGNELYGKGQFSEALSMYDRAIAMLPENAAYRSNRGAALIMLGRLGEAVMECEEAVRLDSGYIRAHQRLVSLYLRLGQVESARHHLFFNGQQPDVGELQKLISLEKHLNRCADARKSGDWKSALRECDAAMMSGAVSSPQIVACKTEALLKLHQHEDAESNLSHIPKLDPFPASCSQTRFFGMLSEAYILFVQAQVDIALGRFENAVLAAEKAVRIDYSNIEVAMLLNNVKLVTRARSHGKSLFDAGRFSEACEAFGEGLKYDLANSVLYCNRAVCWSKLGLWEQSVEDCNQALKIQPNYTKALLRRAASNTKLERWSEAVKDYELLRRQLPGDNEVAEALLRAQTALKRLRQEEVHCMKGARKVEEVDSLAQFKVAISSPGVSLVHFTMPSNPQCEQISTFVYSLCAQYPSVNFIKVNAEESPSVAKTEGIKIYPTFNIYKNGEKVKEMICPSRQALESSVRQYIL